MKKTLIKRRAFLAIVGGMASLSWLRAREPKPYRVAVDAGKPGTDVQTVSVVVCDNGNPRVIQILECEPPSEDFRRFIRFVEHRIDYPGIQLPTS